MARGCHRRSLQQALQGLCPAVSVASRKKVSGNATAAQQAAVGCIHDAVTVQFAMSPCTDFQLVFDLFERMASSQREGDQNILV